MSQSPTNRKPAFEQFAAARRYQPTIALSPDGAEVAYSVNTSGQFNIWRQGLDGGCARQVTTFADESVREIAWSPDGQTVLFLADRHGNEFYQIYAVAPHDGWPEQYASEPDVQHVLGPWSPDGSAFAYAANDREPSDQDILVRDRDGGAPRRLIAGDGSYFPGRWSPNGGSLTVAKMLSNTNMDVYLLDVRDGSHRNLFPHEGDVRYAPGPWAADGSGFYVITDLDREHLGLAFYDLASGGLDWRETPDWDLEAVELSKDGRTLVWVVNENGFSRLYGRDVASGKTIPMPETPDGVIGALAISDDGRRLAFLLTTPTRPAEVYAIDLAAGSLTRLTDGFLGGIPETSMVKPSQVRFPTFDGREIPALLYRPPGDGPFGVVLSIHGGPEAQERPTYAYNGFYQYLLSRGIGVLAPNIRGSTGYGKAYQMLIHRDFGGDDLKDFEAAATYLRGLAWVDKSKIGLFGGSYGGFAVLSCVSRLPDYWAAAVDIVGPSNLVTFAKAVPPTWRRFMADWVGDPETEADFLLARSPISYVDQIKAPLFVIQGANDPRVVKAESDQIVERLRSRGVEVRYDVYEDEGHGFTKRANELKALKDAATFLEARLSR
jgi:dipeptidyl aminopeptidase/acylaminoacyl peptidase